MGIQRRALGRGFALVSTTMERAGFLAAFSERLGGVSEGPFRALNVGASTGDDPARVAENRRRLIDGLSIPPFALGGQVHGARVARVGPSRAGSGFAEPDGAIPASDVLVTGTVGVPLAVLTADCVPLVLASPAARRVAVVHAGWRGLAAGVIRAAVARFGAADDILAAIGPAIGPCHYEVGEDVALDVAAGSEAGARTVHRDGSLRLDLVGTARDVLRAAGVRRIESVGLCTACERRRFFSHRRDGGTTGRQAAVAMRLA
jgi:hypothetical protein